MTRIANCIECRRALQRTPCTGSPDQQHRRVVEWRNQATRSGPAKALDGSIRHDAHRILPTSHVWCAGCRSGHVRGGEHEIELQIIATQRFGNPGDEPLSSPPKLDTEGTDP